MMAEAICCSFEPHTDVGFMPSVCPNGSLCWLMGLLSSKDKTIVGLYSMSQPYHKEVDKGVSSKPL